MMACHQAIASTSYTIAAPPPRRGSCRRPVAVRVAPASGHATVTVMPSQLQQERAVGLHPDPSKQLFPSRQEEKDVSHEAFMHAMEAARPKAMRIPGMQEFAGSLWGRRRIPSQTYSDPLDHIFTEFDTDDDGKLTAAEITRALVSRGVAATEEVVQMFIEASDVDHDHLVSRSEFPNFIFHMASADLRSVTSFASAQDSSPVLLTPPKPSSFN